MNQNNINKNQILRIISDLSNLQEESSQREEYMEKLDSDYFIFLQALFWLGRSGWERNYYESDEYLDYEDDKRCSGETVSQKESDDLFLTSDEMEDQWQYHINHSKNSTPLINGNVADSEIGYLSEKTNLISCLRSGLDYMSQLEEKTDKTDYYKI